MRTFLLLLLLSQTQPQTQFTHNRFTEGGKTFSQDGTSLMTDCMSKVEQDPAASMFCAGYVEGIADVLSDSAICISPEVDGKQLVNAVVRYTEKHQEALHRPASRIVVEALKEQYPCSLK